MADLLLTWYIKGFLSETGVAGSNYGVEYTLDKSYKPEKVRLRLKEKPAADGEPLTIDINADGESIFPDDKPILADEKLDYIFESMGTGVLVEGTVITLDIDKVSPKTSGKDLTVQLDLVEA